MEQPIRVIVNNQSTLGKRTGIGHYAAELITHLSQRPEVAVSCYYPEWFTRFRSPTVDETRNAKTTQQVLGKETTKSQLKAKAVTKLKGVIRRSIRLFSRYKLSPRFFDLYHEPNFIPLPSHLPTIATIPDLSPMLYPQWHPKDRVQYFEKYFFEQLKKVTSFVTISETIREEMITKLGLAPERVGVTYMGVRDHLRPISDSESEPVLNRLGLNKGYFLHVGTVEPRKNLLTLMQAYVGLPENVRQQAKLVLVGGWGWNTQEVQDYFTSVAQSAGVIHLGYSNEADLPAIYCGARALVYPSHYEGFGMPAAEMLACGGVVLASDAQAIQEVIAGCGAKIPAQDVTAWREAMRRAIDDPTWLESLRKGGLERAKLFTWQNCASQTISIYQQVANR